MTQNLDFTWSSSIHPQTTQALQLALLQLLISITEENNENGTALKIFVFVQYDIG